MKLKKTQQKLISDIFTSSALFLLFSQIPVTLHPFPIRFQFSQVLCFFICYFLSTFLLKVPCLSSGNLGNLSSECNFSGKMVLLLETCIYVNQNIYLL